MKDDLPQWTTRVFRYLRRFTNDDDVAAELTQETMLKALRANAQLSDPKKITGWLFKIATNTWNDWCRERSRWKFAKDEVAQQESNETNSLDSLIQKEEADCLFDAVSELPERQKQVLTLFTWEHFTISEIANTLEISQGSVRSNLYEARKTLRTKFGLQNQSMHTKEISTRKVNE